MLKTRIIPCLDVIKNKVVKGVNFKNIRVMGNAVEMAKYYSLSGADELCMLDINASYQNRKTFKLVPVETNKSALFAKF